MSIGRTAVPIPIALWSFLSDDLGQLGPIGRGWFQSCLLNSTVWAGHFGWGSDLATKGLLRSGRGAMCYLWHTPRRRSHVLFVTYSPIWTANSPLQLNVLPIKLFPWLSVEGQDEWNYCYFSHHSSLSVPFHLFPSRLPASLPSFSLHFLFQSLLESAVMMAAGRWGCWRLMSPD